MKEYEITMSVDEFNAICEANEEARPIMVLREKIIELIQKDGNDPYMYDPTFYVEDPYRMTAKYNEHRIKPTE